ncbi:MAG: hypothetical protein C0618_03655 [Desulfuromonas sp.]|nr:MAG: hypothetical protein C0618_03655 [Desulfuromonas sp.]
MKGSRAAHLGLMLSAASGLIYEVVATDQLFFYFSRSTYSVSTVLAVFLSGLGVGSFLVHKYRDRIKNPAFWFGWSQILIAIYVVAVLVHLTSIIPNIGTVGIVGASFVLLLVPTVMLGAVFPLAGSMIGAGKDMAGLVYFIDLLGAVAGTLLAGFWLIPVYGNDFALYFGVLLNLLAALVLFRKALVRSLCVAACTLIVLLMYKTAFMEAGTIGETFTKSSPYGLVEVREGTLFIDGRDQCAESYSTTASERMVVTFSLEPFASRDIDVLNIGLGCGLTLQKVVDRVDKRVDVVEINPVVVEAEPYLSDILDNQQVNLIVDNGLSYLRNSQKKYDSIILDIENPAVIHSSDLYTVEAFEIIRDSLNEDGVFGLWTYACRSDVYYELIYNSLKYLFPYVYKITDNIYIASKKVLGYQPYKRNFKTFEVNSIKKKILSRLYFEECGDWVGLDRDHIIIDGQSSDSGGT